MKVQIFKIIISENLQLLWLFWKIVRLCRLNFKPISDLEVIKKKKNEGQREQSGQNATNWEKYARIFITIDAFVD